MKLHIIVEQLKDATGVEKRVMSCTLKTEVPGMERITAVAELDQQCLLGQEVTELIARMLAAKQVELKAKVTKEKNERKKLVKKV